MQRMHLLNARQLCSAKDELLQTGQKYVSDFGSKLTPGVIQLNKRHKTTQILKIVQLKLRA